MWLSMKIFKPSADLIDLYKGWVSNLYLSGLSFSAISAFLSFLPAAEVWTPNYLQRIGESILPI
jgi:hypothetical protein